MPATITLRQIIIEMVERYSLGRVIPVSSNTTTTFTLTTTGSPELRGPFTGAGIAIGSPVICTEETSGASALGHRTYVSQWAPNSGVLTVSPAIGDTDVTQIVVLDPFIRDADRLIEAINRALQNRIGRWELRPLTYVPDGDMQGTTVSDFWTAAANGTASYVAAQVFPAGGADAAGQVHLNRLVQLVSSGGGTSMDGNGIRVHPSAQTRTWVFLTAIRLVSGSGTATFVWRDNTNGADIDAQVTHGNGNSEMSVTEAGDFLLCAGTFDVPATCVEIAPRLSLSATGMTAQLAPVIAFPVSARAFPLPNRINSDARIGNFYGGGGGRTPGGLMDIWRCQFTSPLVHRIHDYGDHRTVSFEFVPTRPVWYEEYVQGSALAAMTDTTTFPLDRVVKWAYAELMDQLMRQEYMRRATVNDVPAASHYRALRNAAFKSAGRSMYEPELKHIVGRR